MQTSASERVWVVSTYRHPAPPLFYLRNNQIKLSLFLRLFVCVYLCVCSSIIGCYLEIYITTYSKLTYQNVHTHIDLLTVNHQHGLTRNTCTCFIIVRAGIKVFVFSVIQQKKQKNRHHPDKWRKIRTYGACITMFGCGASRQPSQRLCNVVCCKQPTDVWDECQRSWGIVFIIKNHIKPREVQRLMG